MQQNLSLHSGSKCILNPVNRNFAGAVSINTDDIKSTHATTKTFVSGQKYRRSTDKLSLFTRVDGQNGFNETCASAVPNLDENQAGVVEHDQINFASSRTKVSANWSQAIAAQKIERHLLGVET